MSQDTTERRQLETNETQNTVSMATLKHKRYPPQLSHAHTHNTAAFSLDGCLCGSMVRIMNTLLLTDDPPELLSMGRQQKTRKD